MSAVAPGPNEHYLKVFRIRFRNWRGTRPFWAGLFTMLSGLPIAYFPYAHVKLGNLTLAMQTTGASSAAIIGVLLVTLGLTMWFHHIVRVFAGVAAIILGLVSFPLSNFGGFFMGLLLSLIGGGLAIAWAPGESAEQQPEAEGAQPARAGAQSEPAHAEQPDVATSEQPSLVKGEQPEPEKDGRPAEEPDSAPQAEDDHGGADTTLETNGGRHSAG
ncbi:DUF6114 domain-containing protein [Streptomyces sp. KLOTTS4A1]|uniref:DUF6114 domain-containing protein n=1 Tax=Streptomyces sp. KLOTTS4A1 TaxID=3390996 RepID=UPI0039F5030D